MSYEHDIFISYRRDCPTTAWMKNVFLPELKKRLTPKRPNGINIFDDEQIRVASTWPQVLYQKVAASRLLLPMLTPYYFGSEWCRRELALMMEREDRLDLRSCEQGQCGLVIPICLCDGVKFPPRLKDIQLGLFKEFTDARRGTRKWYEFEGKIETLADALDQILDDIIPDYDAAWLGLTGDEIEPQLRIPPPPRKTPPRLADSPVGFYVTDLLT